MRTAVVFIAFCLLLAGCGESAGSSGNFSGTLSGGMPAIQTVGAPFDMTEFVSNTGNDLTAAVLDLSGCSDHWVIDSVNSNGSTIDQENTEQYDLGPVGAGAKVDASISMVPKDAGSHTCDISLFQGDGSGGTTGDSLYDATVTVAINP